MTVREDMHKFDPTLVPGEPYFILVARDPQFAPLIRRWIQHRQDLLECGELPDTDKEWQQLDAAKLIASEGIDWRLKNASGTWRQTGSSLVTSSMSNVFRSDSHMTTNTSSLRPPQLIMPTIRVITAISKAATATGCDMATLLAFAHIESSFNPDAKSSSALGLYQFTNSTWNEVVTLYGKKYGVTPDQIFDPYSNAVMAACNISRYEKALATSGFFPSAGNAYVLHFLGISGGLRLITEASTTPDVSAHLSFPIASHNNPDVFKERTVKELFEYLDSKTMNLYNAYSVKYAELIKQSKVA